MATYYPSSSNQREIMPTLYVRDPRNSAYQESSLPGNMVYLDYSDNLAGHGHLQPQQNCAELLVPTAMLSQDSSTEASESTSSHQGILSNLVASRLGEHVYNVWRDGRNEMLFMQPTGALTTVQTVNGQINSTEDLVQRSVTEDPQMGIRTQLGVLHSGQNLQLQRPNVSAVQGQGLSLSLSTHIPSAIPMPTLQFQHANPSISFLGPHQSASGDDPCKDDSSRNKQSRNRDISPLSGGNRAMKGDLITDNVQCAAALKQMQANPSSYGLLALASTIPNSKYLKAAQQLLEEVVNVRKALKTESDKHQGFHMSVGLMRSKESDEGLKGPAAGLPSNPQESTTNSADRLSPVERQDLQMKLTKLLAMQDEVDRRYKQYYHQMQMVVSSFDVIAGRGAAKPYTALALQTISRHFRCLRDALSGQIRATRRSLGEQDNNSNGKSGSISRLRYVDQQLRQQRALQQLGMMQQHAWRPQRGLPENSVSILRAWLFEHFLHPYPKDSDKLMLARQTGLSRSQVSNWFINARVRLWKPMVEEMYKEELGNTEMDSNSSSDCGPKAEEEAQPSEDREEPQSSKPATERCHVSQFNDSKANPISESEIAAPPCFHNGSSAQNNIYGNLKARNQRPNTEDCSLLQDALVHPDGSGRFMLYQVPELRRFDSEPYAGKACISNGGGVSLTLGLQHCDGGLSGSGSQQNYVTVREDEMYNAGPVGTEAADYDCLNLASRRHRFRSNHLLHDFVA